MVTGVICLAVMSAGGLNAASIWNNGTPDANFSSNPYSDSYTSGIGPFTIFDNFTVGSTGWVVSGFDITDFFVNTPTTDYKSTTWYIFHEVTVTGTNPLGLGTLVAQGSVVGSLTLLSATGCTTCLYQINGNAAQGFTPVTLAAGTYYLASSNVMSTPATDQTYRAFASGNAQTPLAGWEWSNGSVVSGSWSLGTAQYESSVGDTAFDINGTTVPEPGTLVLMSFALAGLGYKLRRRAA